MSGTTAFVDDELVLPGGEVLLRVVASDGLMKATAEFGPINVPEGQPTGVVVAPETVPQYSAERMTFSAPRPRRRPHHRRDLVLVDRWSPR